LLALLGAHHIFHVSRLSVKVETHWNGQKEFEPVQERGPTYLVSRND